MGKKELKKILKANINLAGLISDSIDGIVEPALKKVVADSPNKIDDIIMAALYQPLENELKKQIVANLDWDKIIP